jgi:serine protease inhibitor
VKEKGLKSNGTRLLLVYTVNFLGEHLHTIKKALVARKEFGLKVNADKTKRVFVSGELNAVLDHDTNIANKPFESADGFKYLGTN